MDVSHQPIRWAAEADLPAIVDLDHEAFAPYGTAEQPNVFAARLATFPEGFIVLQVGDRIAGYACSEKWRELREPAMDEDPFTTHDPSGRVLCITGLAVRREYRGRGYALAMLDYLIRLAQEQGCRQIVLETSNAQGLYHKRGFEVVNERRDRGAVLSVMLYNLDGLATFWMVA